VGMLETDFTNAPKPKKSKWDWGSSARIYNFKMYTIVKSISTAAVWWAGRTDARDDIIQMWFFFFNGASPIGLVLSSGPWGKIFPHRLLWGRPFLAYLFFGFRPRQYVPHPFLSSFFQIKNVLFFSFGLNFCRKF
jgi:hypothetical protein